ncbi:MAG: family 10 glycosylhydrolase [Chloroflexi bacterium]|nr:family 10 glycosylhydrolase [Chloroflexota bacterium]
MLRFAVVLGLLLLGSTAVTSFSGVVPSSTPTSVPTATAVTQPTATAQQSAPLQPTGTAQQSAPSLQLTGTAQPTATPIPMDPPELRAVWVDAFHDGFKTAAQVDQLVTWARNANLNALFVQVRRRGDAYYLRSFEPGTEDPDFTPGFDALQYLIDKAHQGPQRLQVHAWLATLPIWGNRDTPPVAGSHVFNLHGPSADPSSTWLMYRDDGEAWAGTPSGGMYYLDPGNPDAARYTTDVYLNLVRQYDVDGIHLDQVRYFEGDALRWGYNPTSVARFNKQSGRDPSTQPDPNDPDWIAWRRDQVTALVRRTYLEVKALKPRIAVTAAVVTWGKGPQSSADWQRQAAFASVLQDWREWLQEGIVDYVLPMDYYRESDPQSAWFDAWTTFEVANVGQRGVVLGLGSYLNDAGDALAQLSRARALHPLGVALYSYAVPTRDLENAASSDRDAFAAQLRSVFARPAPVPDLAWLAHPALGGVLLEAPGQDGLQIVLRDAAGTQRTLRTDGTGVTGAFDLSPGSYTLTLNGTTQQMQITAGAVTLLRTTGQ